MGRPPAPCPESRTFPDTPVRTGVVPSAEQEAGGGLLVPVPRAGAAQGPALLGARGGGQRLGEAGCLLVGQHRVGLAILLGIYGGRQKGRRVRAADPPHRVTRVGQTPD